MNNTDTYWDVDGESLHTFAHSIETLNGLLRVPTMRGEDITIPNRHGQIWAPKVPDSQTLSLSMFVRGIANGSAVDGQDTRPQFFTNWNNLIRLLWTPGRQFELTKRFYDGSTDLIAATALAEFSSGMEPTMQGRKAGKFVVDLKLADPYFYGPLISIPLSNGTNLINIPGSAETRNIKVSISGSRTNLKVRNQTAGVEFTYSGPLASDRSAVVDVQNFEATETPSGGPAFDSDGKVVHSGDPSWLVLKPGDNTIVVSSDSGAGPVILEVRGAWL